MTQRQGDYNVDSASAKIEQRNKESSLLLKYAAIKKAQEDMVGAAKIYIDMTNDFESALVLDELLFWTIPKNGKTSLRVWKEGYLWVAVSRNEWFERKRLSKRQADRAISKLIKLNLIHKSIHKFNASPTTHLRINIPVFFESLYVEVSKIALDDENKDLQDIKDLYAMMGFPMSPNGNIDPLSPNGKLPNGYSDSPFGDSELPNGNNINSPDSALTQPPHRKARVKKSKQTPQPKTTNPADSLWYPRSAFSPELLPLADLVVEKFGAPITENGEVGLYIKTIKGWLEVGVTSDDWKPALYIASRYSNKVVSITGMTKALKTAAQERKGKEKQEQAQPDPAPAKKYISRAEAARLGLAKPLGATL